MGTSKETKSKKMHVAKAPASDPSVPQASETQKNKLRSPDQSPDSLESSGAVPPPAPAPPSNASHEEYRSHTEHTAENPKLPEPPPSASSILDEHSSEIETAPPLHFHKRRGSARTVLLLLLLSAGMLALGYYLRPSLEEESNRLRINEVVTSNAHSLVHETLGTPDWLELYNGTESDLSLSGYTLSTSKNDISPYTLPDVTIPSGEYLVIYCANIFDGGSDLVSGFKLSKNGVTVTLRAEDGARIDSVSVPPLQQDISYARNAAGEFQYCLRPTPGAENSGTFADELPGEASATVAAPLAISEVMPKNDSTLPDGNGEYYDWVELCNSGSEAVSLRGYFLSDDPAKPDKAPLPDAAIPPGGRLVVFLSRTGSDPGAVYAPMGLNASENIVLLADKNGNVLSSLTWDIPISAGVSVGPDGPGGKALYYTSPTPGEANMPESGLDTLAYKPVEESAFPIRINEILRDNEFSGKDQDGDLSPWAELYNASDASVTLHGYALSDDQAEPGKWSFPDVALGPGEYLVVFLSGKDMHEGSELHTSFKLGNADKSLVLSRASDMSMSVIPLEADIPNGVSYGRDASGAWAYYPSPSPGVANPEKGFATLSAAASGGRGPLRINEVSAAKAAKSRQADWIELKNTSDSAVNLDGWFLSDSPEQPDRYALSGEIGPGEYITVQAGGGENAAPFSLSASGETLLLTDSNGAVCDVFCCGATRAGVTCGVDEITGDRAFFTEPTPGAANAAPIRSYAREPVFSAGSGYYSGTLEVSLSCVDGGEIRYTTDGSEPNASSPLYTAPLPFSQTTVLKARAYAPGLLESDAVSATYLFEEHHTIPVVSISTAPGDLSAVYAVSTRDRNVERKAQIDYIPPDGTVGISFPAGVRVSGNSTRSYAQKSLAIALRGGYGRSSVTYPFFGDYPFHTFSALVLRNSGQDISVAHMRDALSSRIVLGMDVDAAATRCVAVYLNGKYWGLYDLKEDLNPDYLQTHYGSGEDNADVIRRNITALHGSNRDYKQIRAIATRRNMADDAALAEFCTRVDALGFADYIIAKSFLVDSDMYNQKYWRTQDNVVRWRPVFFDLDFALKTSGGTNVLGQYFIAAGVPSPDGTTSNMDVPVALRKNAKWRDEFIRRYAVYLSEQLSAQRLTALVDEMAAEMEPEMARHIARWGKPTSMETWKRNVASLRSIVAERPENAYAQLKHVFNVDDAYIDALVAKGQDAFWADK